LSFEFFIDRNVEKLMEKQEKIAFQDHIGGGLYVSITSGFNCIDLREFYFHKTKGFPCPSRRGIALRVQEWERLKQVFQEINTAFPALSNTLPCVHFISDNCHECRPFEYEEQLFTQKLK
jgi:Transcriptional Coactivator p15 (PC4)